MFKNLYRDLIFLIRFRLFYDSRCKNWKYKVKLKDSESIIDERFFRDFQYNRIYNWLNENIQGRYEGFLISQKSIYFSRSEDAMMFKLVWG